MNKLYAFIIVAVSFLLSNCQGNINADSNPDFDHDEFVPRWAKEVVWYQIFPERFYNGDTTNDPTVDDIAGADPQELPEFWQIHPWTSDWYELKPYELQNKKVPLYRYQLRRRYGGDIQGIIEKLDYLKDFGITAIYFNPLFDAPSLHKYDGASYHHIDPNFGPDPKSDRELMKTENPIDPSTWVWTSADELALKMIQEAHKRGMRVIFDGVFNHMGINSFAFKDVVEKQQDSPYKDWFIIKSWNNDSTGEKFAFNGWFGVQSLPELKEDSSGIVKGPKEYIFAATERWMNPKGQGIENGIDGWRLDVAFCVSHNFWKDWRKHVRSINPTAYLTAEIVDKPEVVKAYLQGDEFDGEMNYNFAFTCMEYFINPDSMRISASEFDQKLKEMRDMYPSGVAYVLQNLYGSHDANRLASHIVNRGIWNYRDWGNYYGKSQVGSNPFYNVSKPTAEDYQLQKLLVIMQMTYVGAPMVYYGEEVGMWGGNDPDCRKPMIWPEFNYDDEVYNPDGTTRAAEKVEVNNDLFNHYNKLIAIRNSRKELQLGSFETLLTDNAMDVYVFSREYQGKQTIVAFNNSSEPVKIQTALATDKTYNDLLNGGSSKAKDGQLALEIQPKWALVLASE
ncbi:MAG: glycoside hydrolase family 13 protein [Bacteroidota bacterium]|nr:MAG: glycoside hydrolase family 13 protein [Bacteroidota bacterium]